MEAPDMQKICIDSCKYLGNTALLHLPKTAFLCSRRVAPAAVLRAYDWAVEQKNAGTCVVSGFHSYIEKNVLAILLQGTQPLIIVESRGIRRDYPVPVKQAIDNGRLLVISSLPQKNIAQRPSEKTADIRNRFIVKISDAVCIAWKRKGGLLDALYADVIASGDKEVILLVG
jgi:predicted Rossmann fold nucleotide-binding protein DprA/Smf involved in DNA uptake